MRDDGDSAATAEKGPPRPKDASGGAGDSAGGQSGGGSSRSAAAAALEKERKRDIRLDFFRGLGMFIILIAHTPGNTWKRWIPARFGWSDATEIFVFCSGAASAIAFYKVYENRGWFIGTARVGFRIWQIYWCHIGVFFATLATLVAADAWLTAEVAAPWWRETFPDWFIAGLDPSWRDMWLPDNWYASRETSYTNDLNLTRFFTDPAPRLLGLMTLTYIPNLFDILPMYLVILAMMPFVIGLGRINPWYAFIFVGGLWAMSSQPWIALRQTPPEYVVLGVAVIALGVAFVRPRLGALIVGALAIGWFQPWFTLSEIEIFTGLNLPAETGVLPHVALSTYPTGDEAWWNRTWFFNPFSWGLVFFTGFAFAVGWLPRPPVKTWLLLLCGAIVLVAIPLDPDGVFRRMIRDVESLQWLRAEITQFVRWAGPLSSKTFFGLFRFVHFLALAYLFWVAAGEGGRRLPQTGIGGRVTTVIRRVGQQSLAVFVASLVISRLLAILIKENGGPDNLFILTLANLLGVAALIAVAYFARFFRAQPWKAPAPASPASPPQPAARGGS